MLKNTYYVILFLSIFAALVIGLNIGKKLQQSQSTQTQQELSIISPTANPSIAEPTIPASTLSATGKPATQSGSTGKTMLYTSASCGVSLSYPDTIAVEESSTDAKGAIFTNKSDPTDIVVLTCQKDIPKPPLPAQNIEDRLIGSTPAKLYHDTSQKDGTKVDALIFTHPKTKLDVFIGGYGATFNTLIQSLKIL